MAHKGNISYISNFIGRLKTVSDVYSPGSTENIYMLGELAELKVQKLCKKRKWALEVLEKDLSLPKSLFKRVSAQESARIAHTNYLRESHRTPNITPRTTGKSAPHNNSSARSNSKAAKQPTRRNAPRTAKSRVCFKGYSSDASQ